MYESIRKSTQQQTASQGTRRVRSACCRRASSCAPGLEMLDAGLIAPSACAPCRRDTYDDAKLLGVYDFIHRGGTFQVHLRAGGHFYAPNFPTKSLWMTMPGKDHKLLIQWKEYGSYALNMISPMPSFHGSEVNKPDNWRQVLCCKLLAHLNGARSLSVRSQISHPNLPSFPGR